MNMLVHFAIAKLSWSSNMVKSFKINNCMGVVEITQMCLTACHGVLLASPCMQFDQGLTRFLGAISLRKLRADSEEKSPNTIITELLGCVLQLENGRCRSRNPSCSKPNPRNRTGGRSRYRSRKARRECLFGRHSRGHYVSSSLPPIIIQYHFNR